MSIYSFFGIPIHHSWRDVGVFAAWLSIAWNIVEGVVSLYVAARIQQLQLAVYGSQSVIEILSSILALHRLRLEFKPNEMEPLSEQQLIHSEKRGTLFMGAALLSLGALAIVTAVWRLSVRASPEQSILGLLTASAACLAMFLLWRVKRRTAIQLNSATLEADAQCSMYCFRDSIIVVFGSLVNWKNSSLIVLCGSVCDLWWLDSTLSIIISALCARDGFRALRNAMDDSFTGGTCGGCCGGPGNAKQKAIPTEPASCKDSANTYSRCCDAEAAPLLAKSATCCARPPVADPVLLAVPSESPNTSSCKPCCSTDACGAIKATHTPAYGAASND